MARYEVQLVLTGSSADAERSLTTLGDAAEEQSARISSAFDDNLSTVGGSIDDLTVNGGEKLSGLADTGVESAARISEGFTESTGKIGADLDEMTTAVGEKTAAVADRFATAFGEAGDASGVLVGKVGESLDAMVAETTEKSAIIKARINEAFASGAGQGLSNLQLNRNAGTLENLGTLGLSDEELAAARQKALASVKGTLASKLSQYESLGGAGVISASELQAAKGHALGLAEEGEAETGGLKSKVAGVFKGIGSSLGNFGLPFTEQFNKMGESIDKANTKAGSFKETLGSIGQLSVEAGVVGIVGVGAESIHLADEYETALSQLTTAIKASGGSLKEFEPALKAADGRMAGLGFNSTQTAQALQILTTATNNPKKAISDLGLVANVARERNISLSDAASTIAKVYAGNTRVLTQWGINLDIGSG